MAKARHTPVSQAKFAHQKQFSTQYTNEVAQRFARFLNDVPALFKLSEIREGPPYYLPVDVPLINKFRCARREDAEAINLTDEYDAAVKRDTKRQHELDDTRERLASEGNDLAVYMERVGENSTDLHQLSRDLRRGIDHAAASIWWEMETQLPMALARVAAAYEAKAGGVAGSAKPIDPTPALPWNKWGKALDVDWRTAKSNLLPYVINDPPAKGRKTTRKFRLDRNAMPEEYVSRIDAKLNELFPAKPKGTQQAR